METIKIKENISAFGFRVHTFPDGIKDAFDTLQGLLPDGIDRTYYGISYMDNDEVVYHAAVQELNPGEAEKYNCERYTIQKGEYTADRVHQWMKKVHTIKDIFSEMLKDECPVEDRPAIEWYLNDDEMICMIRILDHATVAAK
ncbi:hypothetical protein WBG78_17700 [Chryseolinea sp. T2]|uniref:hypothetical protein n=1 Tax=Chryseolinea sp. T2 TaxID=3129255 RepID=UPI003076CF16